MQYFLCVYEWRLSRGRAEWATPEAYHLLTLSYAGQIHQIDHDLDHLDAIIPVWYDVGDLYSIDPTLQQELDHTDEEYVVPCNIYIDLLTVGHDQSDVWKATKKARGTIRSCAKKADYIASRRLVISWLATVGSTVINSYAR